MEWTLTGAWQSAQMGIAAAASMASLSEDHS
jgi:hypothetical protein